MRRFMSWPLACFALILIGCDASPPKRGPAFVMDPAKQQERKEFIEKLIKNRIFTKVEMRATVPDAWITPTFKLLSFDDKQQFCNVVYAYYFPDPNDTASGHHLRLKDSRTGKKVGAYDLVGGLSLD